MNNNIIIEQNTEATLISLDMQYLLFLKDYNADPNELFDLQCKIDLAWSTYRSIRQDFLRDQMICSNADVQRMQEIRQEVEQAQITHELIKGAIRLIRFLSSLKSPLTSLGEIKNGYYRN